MSEILIFVQCFFLYFTVLKNCSKYQSCLFYYHVTHSQRPRMLEIGGVRKGRWTEPINNVKNFFKRLVYQSILPSWVIFSINDDDYIGRPVNRKRGFCRTNYIFCFFEIHRVSTVVEQIKPERSPTRSDFV